MAERFPKTSTGVPNAQLEFERMKESKIVCPALFFAGFENFWWEEYRPRQAEKKVYNYFT